MKIAVQIVLLLLAVGSGALFLDEKDNTKKQIYMAALVIMILMIVGVQYVWK